MSFNYVEEKALKLFLNILLSIMLTFLTWGQIHLSTPSSVDLNRLISLWEDH
jgi:hypothetical protein